MEPIESFRGNDQALLNSGSEEDNPQAPGHPHPRSKSDEVESNSDRDPEKGVLDEHLRDEEPKACTCGYHPNSDLVDFDGPGDPDNPKLPKMEEMDNNHFDGTPNFCCYILEFDFQRCCCTCCRGV